MTSAQSTHRARQGVRPFRAPPRGAPGWTLVLLAGEAAWMKHNGEAVKLPQLKFSEVIHTLTFKLLVTLMLMLIATNQHKWSTNPSYCTSFWWIKPSERL